MTHQKAAARPLIPGAQGMTYRHDYFARNAAAVLVATLGLACAASESGVAGSGATTGSHEEGAIFGPELAVELPAWPHARVHPLLSLSVGASILGVRGTVNGGRDVMASGVFGGLGVGAAVR